MKSGGVVNFWHSVAFCWHCNDAPFYYESPHDRVRNFRGEVKEMSDVIAAIQAGFNASKSELI